MTKSSQQPNSRRLRPFIRVLFEILALVATGLLAIGGLELASRWASLYPVDLTIKEPDTRLELAGFHIPEQNGEFPYRWSQPYAFIQLPHAAGLAPGYIASVRLRVPAQDPNRALTFLLNEHPIATSIPSPAFRVYRLALPVPNGETALRLGMQIPALHMPNDARTLGVVLTRAEISPLREPRPAERTTLVIGVLTLWAILRRGKRIGPTALICAGLAALICGLVALAGPNPLGLAWPIGLALAATLAATIWARATFVQLGLGALFGVAALSGALRTSWLTDDAFISFRYAQNLVAGHGLIYNLGERVEGYTNFLWTILAALVLTLDGDMSWWSYLSGIILALAIILATFVLARQLLSEGWALAAALIVATSQSLLIHTARGAGLETGLFTLLALFGSSLYLDRFQTWSAARTAQTQTSPSPVLGERAGREGTHLGTIGVGLFFALATLTRPEGALLLGVTGLHMFWQLGRTRGWALRPLLRAVLPMALAYILIVLPFFVWRYSYYGDLLPNTFYAKTGGGFRAVQRGLTYTGEFVLALGGPLVLLALVPSTKPSAWRSYLLALCGLYTVYVISVGGDHFPGERFFVLLVPWLAVLIANGVARLATYHRFAAYILGAVLVGYGGYAYTRGPEQDVIIAGSDENLTIWRELGWWLADHSPPDSQVAAMSAGAIAYYSEHTTIDMLGLTDRHIGRVVSAEMGEGPAGHEKRDPAYVLNVRAPTYIPAMWEDYFGGADALRGRYTLISATTRTGRTIALWQRIAP